jgi:hypothetical protein
LATRPLLANPSSTPTTTATTVKLIETRK